MLSILLRIVLPFLLSLFCTYLLGLPLYAVAVHLEWFTAIPFWLLGLAIGFGCGLLSARSCVRAIRWGGAIGAFGLGIPLIAASLGSALYFVVPCLAIYVFVQGIAARSGSRYRTRLARG